VIKNTFLSNIDNASIALWKELLQNYNLRTGFSRCNLYRWRGENRSAFFEKGKATQKVWFYQLNLDRNFGKTNLLNEKNLKNLLNYSRDEVMQPKGP